jgi:hypothetical protein
MVMGKVTSKSRRRTVDQHRVSASSGRSGDAPTEAAKPDHISTRVSADAIARIDALIPHFSTPWRRATRSEILRYLMLQGLGVEEKRAAQVRRARSRVTS